MAFSARPLKSAINISPLLLASGGGCQQDTRLESGGPGTDRAAKVSTSLVMHSRPLSKWQLCVLTPPSWKGHASSLGTRLTCLPPRSECIKTRSIITKGRVIHEGSAVVSKVEPLSGVLCPFEGSPRIKAVIDLLVPQQRLIKSERRQTVKTVENILSTKIDLKPTKLRPSPAAQLRLGLANFPDGRSFHVTRFAAPATKTGFPMTRDEWLGLESLYYELSN